jgi:hypothetical protein
MFAIVKDGQIEKMIPDRTAFEYGGKNYHGNWPYVATPEEKAALGLVNVEYDARPDDRFYWVDYAEPALDAASNVVRIAHTKRPKELEDREEVDQDGNPLYVQVYDPVTESMVNTEERLVFKGLKSQYVAQVKAAAHSALSQTDWYIVRKAENDTDVPEKVATKRAEIRAKADVLEVQIKAVTSVDELAEINLSL